ncbi:MAG: YbhB/YbcL family Raf kinase inhibitor-like protein [Alphaproteobacteria bacterium]|nr:YbhB/YbcL family Raf kinase inhibitor-like protein [Alphaproteobacteria bacterium]
MRWWWLACGLVACKGDSGVEAEADTDTDADTDSDTDTDTDADADTDTDFVAFAMSSPDLESSQGHPRADECDFWLPDVYMCDGSNPQIDWEGVPAGATHLVLVFDDPDAGNYPHWAIWDIPATETGLAAAISGDLIANTPPGGASEAENGFGWVGYLGSCPGSVHKYRWRLWAVDTTMPSPPTGSAQSQFQQVVTFAQENRVADPARMCHLRGPQ